MYLLRYMAPIKPLASLPALPDDAAVRVLVVEDEPLYAEQVEALLVGMSYEPVGPAMSAQIAMALYRTEPIDLVLLDINLRGPLDGIQLAERILAHNSVPLIFLTSFADEATFQRVQQVSPAAYLTKPIDEQALRRAITLAVRKEASLAWPSQAAEPAPTAIPEAVFVKENGLLERVLLSDIYSVAADNKTCILTLSERTVQVRLSLRELAQFLPAERFVQIQRSYFVNIAHLERLDPTRHLVQVGKQVLPVGRLYLAELISRLRTLS
jgi:DNA-binding LytR/AlgR family response regulator